MYISAMSELNRNVQQAECSKQECETELKIAMTFEKWIHNAVMTMKPFDQSNTPSMFPRAKARPFVLDT